MNSLLDTFNSRSAEWITALIEHLQISLIATLLAISVAVPVAIFISKHSRFSEVVLQITGVFQTIPSLALLGLFIPLMGIGTLPAVVALVIYALFPIMQNTITALNSIDDSLIEAGRAFGMTRWERLKIFMIPLSLPIIISGIRSAAVMVIGTATLASLIGAGGLGTFIMLGIDRNNSDLILIGAISSAVLAVLFNIVLKRLEKANLRIIFVTVVLSLGGLVLSYLPTTHTIVKENETIVIAGKLGAEPEILINMYKLLIEQDTELSVELKPSFGKTSFLYEALKAGDIDIYPEFTGTVTGSLLKNPPQLSTNPRKVYQDARDGILSQDNLVLFPPMLYQNTYALAVPRDFAQQHQLRKISDLSTIQNQLTAGFTLEFNDREDGYLGIQKLYGINFKVNAMEPSLRYQAVNNGNVNIIDAYSTDSQLKQFDLVVLKDDKELFPPYQGAPLMKKELVEKYPELENILNQLAGKISEEEMSSMNYQVDVEGKSAFDVARAYLVSQNLIKEK